MSASLLSSAEVTRQLTVMPSWQIENGELARTFELRDFRAALAFVNQVGELAESANHHPDIDIRYNRVRLALVTHSAGGLTKNDFDLAARIDSLG
jgi:4a-hydroxytetrahydrobiopterin dehydratase